MNGWVWVKWPTQHYYGHVELVNLPNHSFSWAGFKSSKWITRTCAHSFARNWQMPFLNQQKGENGHRKYFMIKVHERMLSEPAGINLLPSDHQSDVHPTGPKGHNKYCLLCWGLTTRQPLWVILCRLPEKGRKEIEEIVEEMKERNREERGTGMKGKKQKK